MGWDMEGSNFFRMMKQKLPPTVVNHPLALPHEANATAASKHSMVIVLTKFEWRNPTKAGVMKFVFNVLIMRVIPALVGYIC